MKASVVVCTRNRGAALAECLRSLAGQALVARGLEVVVVDNGSTDGTAQLLAAWAAEAGERTVVTEPVAGLSRARNRGIEASRGDVVLFLDDDAFAPRGWVAAHLAAYADRPEVVAVGGPVVLTWPDGRPAWLAPRLEHWFSALDLGDTAMEFPRGHGPHGTNMSVRRAALIDAGGFSPRLGRRGRSLLSSEERDLFERVWARGGHIRYEPAALILHRMLAERITRRWLLRRGWAQGRSNARIRAGQHPVTRGELFAICREEATHATRGLRGVASSARRRDTSAVLAEVARRAGHVSGAFEQLWLHASRPSSARKLEAAGRRGGGGW